MIYNILKKRGVKQKLGDRVILPKEGFPLEVKPVEIQTKGGKTIKGDLAVSCRNCESVDLRLMYLFHRSCVLV